MAKIVSVQTVQPTFEKVTVELSYDEAKTLHDITRKIGGPPLGRRRHITAIENALQGVINRPLHAPNYPADLHKNSGSITFGKVQGE